MIRVTCVNEKQKKNSNENQKIVKIMIGESTVQR